MVFCQTKPKRWQVISRYYFVAHIYVKSHSSELSNNHHHHHDPLEFSVKGLSELNQQVYQPIDRGVTLPRPILLSMMMMMLMMMMMMRRRRRRRGNVMMMIGVVMVMAIMIIFVCWGSISSTLTEI